MTSVTLSPTVARTTDPLSVTYEATDADEDALTPSYSWTVNGAEVGTDASLSSGYVHGDEVVVAVTVEDGEGASDRRQSEALVIANTPPTQPVAAITPANPSDDDALVCGVTVPSTDADGEPLQTTARWTRDGVPFDGAQTTTLPGDTVPASATSRDEVWACTVEVTDGTDTATAETVSVQITGVEVLLLWDVEDRGTPSLVEAFEAAGYSVTLPEVSEHQWNGTNPAPDGFDVVVHLNGTTFDLDMNAGGQQALVDFVDAGGGYLHTEWNGYETDQGRHTILRQLDALNRTGGGEGADRAWQHATGSHPLHDAVPSSFTVAGYCGYSPGQPSTGATEVLTWTDGSTSRTGLAEKPYGDGIVLGYAFAGNDLDNNPLCLEDPYVEAMLVAGVLYAAQGAGGL